MGSWNATCAISHLSIGGGAKVRVIFLNKSPYGDKNTNGVYQNNFWAPRTVGIRATYADYGEVDEIEQGFVLDAFWAQLKEDVCEVEQGENPYHEHGITKKDVEEKNWSQVWELGREGRLRVGLSPYSSKSEGEKQAGTACTPIMILEDVWQQMLILENPHDAWESIDGGRREGGPTISRKIGVNYFYKRLEKELQEHLELIEKAKISKPGEMDFAFRFGRMEHESIFYQMNTGTSQGISAFFDWIKDGLKDGSLDYKRDKKQIEKLMRDCAELVHIHCLFSPLRISWGLTTGCGSQDENQATNARFHKAMAKVGFFIERDNKKRWGNYGSEKEYKAWQKEQRAKLVAPPKPRTKKSTKKV